MIDVDFTVLFIMFLLGGTKPVVLIRLPRQLHMVDFVD